MKRRMWLRPGAVLLAIACAVFATVARAEETPVYGDWLIQHLNAEPATLNLITATDAYASSINGYIYESMLRRDEKTLELVPQLADSWEIAPDHLTYVFHLKKNVLWQDGVPFTARDVVFSFDRIQDPKVDAAPLRNYYKDIETVEAVDDYTVRFRYRIPYFLALEFCGGIPIVPEHVFKPSEDFNQHSIGRMPVGNGPYKMLRWDTGKEIVLVRNERYYGKKPWFDRIVFKIITNPTASLQVLKEGGLDFMGLLPIQWVKQTQSKRFNTEYKKLKYYAPSYRYIGWNNRKVWFSDARVRRAMTMLMNRQEFLDKILYGLGTVVHGTFFVNSPEYDKSIQPYPYDPAGAVALLKEAGWEDHDGDGILDKDGVPFSFEFMLSSGSKTGEQIATILEENLRDVGIRMTIHQLEWAVFVQRIQEHNFDACTLAWSLGWESDPYQLWHSSQGDKGSNYIGFANKEADEIIETARQEFDTARRLKLYHRFDAIIHEEQPYTFLFTTESLVAVSSRFQNVHVYPLGLEPREWWTPLALQKYKEP